MEPAKDQETQAQESSLPNETKRQVEKELYAWTAPARPFKRRNREFYVTVIAIAVIVGLILFLTEGFMPVVLLIALVFLFYVMNTVEPEPIEYKITDRGVKIAGRLTDWEAITRFWFTRRYDSSLLILGTRMLPGRLEVVINEADKDKLKKEISEYVPEEEIPPSALDKAANWFAKKLPGNS